MCCCHWTDEGGCLGTGRQVLRGALRQQDSHLSASTLCLQGLGKWSSGFEVICEFSNLPVTCRVLGAQPPLIRALFSEDHLYENKGLGYCISFPRKLEEFRGEKKSMFSVSQVFKK